MKLRRHWWLILPWAAFILIAASWITYWNVAANTARQEVSAWITAQQRAGADAHIGAIATHGFPVLLRLEMSDLAYAPRGRAWAAHTQRLDLNVNLINPQHVIFDARAPIVIETSGGASTLSARNLLVSVRANGGALAEARLEADDLVFAKQSQADQVRVQKLVAGLRPDPRTVADDQLAIEATALHLAAPVRSFEQFGQDIASANAAIVLEHAAGLFAANDPLGNWTTHSGRARVEGLGLTWGPLQATGEGAVTLDAQHRLQGELEIGADHPAPALNALAHSPSLSHDVKNALEALALSYSLSGHGARAHLTAQDGVLELEHAPVRTLAPMY